MRRHGSGGRIGPTDFARDLVRALVLGFGCIFLAASFLGAGSASAASPAAQRAASRHNSESAHSAIVRAQDGVVGQDGEHRSERGRDGLFYVTAEINGRSQRFLVDTGATSVVLSLADARRLGVVTDSLVFNGSLDTSAGIVPMARASIERFGVGGKVYDNVQVIIINQRSGLALMGQSMLGRFKSLSIENDVLVLR